MENMNEKKNCTAAIVLGIVGIILGLFIPILGIGCGVAGAIVCGVKKEQCKIKSGVILSVLAIVLSIASWIIGVMMINAMMGI